MVLFEQLIAEDLREVRRHKALVFVLDVVSFLLKQVFKLVELLDGEALKEVAVFDVDDLLLVLASLVLVGKMLDQLFEERFALNFIELLGKQVLLTVFDQPDGMVVDALWLKF